MNRPARLRLLLLLTALVTGCEPPSASQPLVEPPAVVLPQTVKSVNADQAAAMVQAGGGLTLLDVREDWEITKFGRIAGSVWADFLNERRFEEAAAQIDRAKPCLVYCAIGGRSRLAVEKLAARGFTDLSWLAGGFEAWIQAGKPVQGRN